MGGAALAEKMGAALRDSGVELGTVESVLDFGCGCGRVARYLPPAGVEEVHGCDYNPELVDWCNSNLPFMRAEVNGIAPPTPYPDESFELVYALSVLTHLDEPLQQRWISELRRLLRPDGVLLITTLGSAAKDRMLPKTREQFERGQLIVERSRAAGTNTCTAYHPPAYVERTLFGDRFRPLRFVEGTGDYRGVGGQDMYVARRPRA